MANKYLDCCLEVGDNIRPFIREGRNGKKYLYFKIMPRKNGADQYGKTHTMSIRYQGQDGQYYTAFIGDATEKEFQAQALAPAPQGGYAPQGQYNQPRQYQQAPPQGSAEVRQQYQQGYAPQYAPQSPAPHNLPPQAPPPTYTDATAQQAEVDDLPF